MSGRRSNASRIRGPQSALTDFLAANNISAAQIQDDWRRRVEEAERQEQQAANNGEGPSNAADADEDAEAAAAAAEAAIERSRKRKRNEKEAIDKIKDAKKQKKGKKSKKELDSDGDFDDTFDMYKRAKPMPGQFEHCELCNKRFTVTPYSKEGPDGGLLCTPCGKQFAKDVKKEEKAMQKKPAGRKRRQAESNRLDGIAPNRAKSLQQLCIERVVQYHDDVDELGDMPQALLEKVSAIFSKKRVLNSKTLKLFVRPDQHTISIGDAANLEVDDYIKMFQVSPNVSKVVLNNAGQLKDEAIAYMLDKCDRITYLHLYAANLVSNEMWLKVFERYSAQLEAVKLQWLDATFGNDIAGEMIRQCPDLRRLKLTLCRRIGQDTIIHISQLKKLEHLSLQIGGDVASEVLVDLVKSVGPGLRTLSLEHFLDLGDEVLDAIHHNCAKLAKLRISENDTATDAEFAALFTDWVNPPLHFADFNTTRDVDNNNPTGPQQAIGLADAGFKALMEHSGSMLRHLNISSCRHISLETFNDVFDGAHIYPALEYIDVSFCSCVDTRVIAGIFKSCPAIKKVIAFGCFDVMGVTVPQGVILIGVPKAQDAIEQIGVGIGVEEAVSRMVEVAA